MTYTQLNQLTIINVDVHYCMLSLSPRHLLEGTLDETFHSTCVDKASYKMPACQFNIQLYHQWHRFKICGHENTGQQKYVNYHNADRVGRLHETITIYVTEVRKCAQSAAANGVPRVLILGSLLFIIYINELLPSLNASSIPLMFADDTSLIISSKNLNDFCTLNTKFFF